MNINIRTERYNGQRRYSHYGSYIITNQKVLATGYIEEKDKGTASHLLISALGICHKFCIQMREIY